MHYILDALKVNVKLVSPSNHGSLKTERYIQTINNLITRQLTGKEENGHICNNQHVMH